jgi:two-component system, OmpR family, alkaline phosphatase synthesis response regulator PhoP
MIALRDAIFTRSRRNGHTRPLSSRMPAKIRILTVDDEPDLIAMMQFWLERAGHEVVTASTGYEALVKVAEIKPDLILLDLMLPDLDGFGVCEFLRRDPETATVPIIIVSAWSTTDSKNLGLDLGALDYITKPYSPRELVRRVNHFLDQRATGPRSNSA